MLRAWTAPAVSGPLRHSRTRRSLAAAGLYVLLAAAVCVGGWLFLQRMGLLYFLIMIIMGSLGAWFAYASYRSLMIPLAVLVFSVGGFRFLLTVTVPALPDVYLDRLALIWLAVIFAIKYVAEGRSLRGPYLLDMLVLMHGLFVLIRIMLNEYSYFNLWTQSYLVPFATYFLAKNICTSSGRIRQLLLWLAIINFYYSITAIAEKLGITALIWPKSILSVHTAWVGRSHGPFLHAPLFGTVMGMILPIYLYFIATARGLAGRAFGYTGLLLGLAGIYFTYTRGAWMAAAAALGVTVLLGWRHYFRLTVPALILVPLLALFVLGLRQDPLMKSRIEAENTIEGRVGVAVTALRIWQSAPLFGVGFFGYRAVLQDFIQPVDVPFFGTVKMALFRHNVIHDIYLGQLAEYGVVGFGLLVAIYVLIFRTLLDKLRYRRDGDHFAVLQVPLLAGIFAGYLVGGLAIDYRFFAVVGVLFFGAAGILYGYRPEEPLADPGRGGRAAFRPVP